MRALAIVSALAVTFVGTPVWAQAAALLEEVVVTATLLPETSTSVSATIINERAQALRGAAHLEDVITHTQCQQLIRRFTEPLLPDSRHR